MRYEEFKARVKDLPLLSGQLLKLLAESDRGFQVQFSRWIRAGKILRLRKGLYLLNQEDLRINPSRPFVAREMYSPSYISMEYALSLYGLIPERVSDLTSITTKKTVAFQTPLGRFVYQHVKKSCFFGFREMKDEAGLAYLLALPEKALVDFLYLNQHLFKEEYELLAEESFRLQNLHSLDSKKLLSYAESFGGKKLLEIVNRLRRMPS